MFNCGGMQITKSFPIPHTFAWLPFAPGTRPAPGTCPPRGEASPRHTFEKFCCLATVTNLVAEPPENDPTSSTKIFESGERAS